MHSIRRRLLWTLLAGIAVLLLAAGAAVYGEIRDEVGELFDAQLQQTAQAFPHISARAVAADLAADEAADSPLSRMVVEVRRPGDTAVLYHSRKKPLLPADAPAGWSTITVADHRWRLFRTDGDGHSIEVAQPLSVRARAADEIAARLLAPLAAALPLAALLIWLTIGRGLRPLTHLSEELQSRSPESLQPVPTAQLPRELLPMATSLNALLQRLQQALEAQRRFIADAAHELLTPLTALQLQSQLLERAPDDRQRALALRELRAGIQRSIRLTRQLLTLARRAPEARQAPHRVLDLAAIAGDAVAAARAAAAARDQQLELSAETAPLTGDAVALRTLIDNLIDNAVKYTPPGGRVRIQVAGAPDGVRLDVHDDGPGIAQDQLTRAADRFYRVPGSGGGGSGLGLAIVREIAAAHGAQLLLKSPGCCGGLTVHLQFPQRKPVSE